MTFQPGIAMEYTQDLHLKMSKKIAQLTKVRLRLSGLAAGKSLAHVQDTDPPWVSLPLLPYTLYIGAWLSSLFQFLVFWHSKDIKNFIL